MLMGLMALRVMAASLAHSRFGPKTTAKLVLVILFWSQWADTCGGKSGLQQVPELLPPPSFSCAVESHLHQEGSEETEHLVVLLGQRPKDLQRHLHSLALINVCEEWGPTLQGPRAGWLRTLSQRLEGRPPPDFPWRTGRARLLRVQHRPSRSSSEPGGREGTH